MEDRLAHHDCPGVSIAVIEDGKLAWAAGFGQLETGQPAPVDTETLFSGASISKPITALMALRLIDQGRLSLDEDVNRYLKRWQLPQNEFTAQSPVTLRWLLSHMAGTTVHGFGGFPPGEPLPTALDVLEGRPPAVTPPVRVDKVPGQSVRYSGGGTTLVQVLLEDVSGKDFETLARELVLQPLGMTRTTFVNPLPESLRRNAAVGHENGETIAGKWVCVPQIAAGGIWTTASDYARFMIAARQAWAGAEGALLSRPLAAEMMTSQGGVFGLGWEVMGKGASKRFSHGGSNSGYQCEAMCLLESGNGAVVLTNAESGLIFYWEVFAGIARAQGWEGFMPAPRQVDPIRPDEMDRYVGVYDILSGVEMPELRAWEEGGALFTQIPGMRGGPNRTLRDRNGRLFNLTRPSETEVIFGPDGKAQELSLKMFGQVELIRMRRRLNTAEI
jgi:CubicO group peptidase (beta-lactamase class C family)